MIALSSTSRAASGMAAARASNVASSVSARRAPVMTMVSSSTVTVPMMRHSAHSSSSCFSFSSSCFSSALRNRRSARLSTLAVRASSELVVKEPATGLEFPEVTSFWIGDRVRCVGAGARTKKIAIVSVKVYAVALYVEAEKAARELGVRSRGGFFDDASTADADFCAALADGAFAKALRIDLVRDVDGATFYSALEEALAPRLRLMGGDGAAALEKFEEFFASRKLTKGTSLGILQRVDGGLDVAVCADRSRAAAAFASPDAPQLRIDAGGFGRALFEVYLGESSVVPDAKKAWAAGARALLATEQVKRDTRKGGS